MYMYLHTLCMDVSPNKWTFETLYHHLLGLLLIVWFMCRVVQVNRNWDVAELFINLHN